MALTVKSVAKLLRDGEPGRHLDGGQIGERGLYLIVAGKTAAHWELRYQLNGRSRWMGLGSARTFTLLEARDRAKRERQRLADKIDPLEVRRIDRAKQAAATASVKTFEECAESYIVAHQAKWRSAVHGQQWTSTMRRFVYPVIGKADVAAIDTAAVLRVLEQKVEASLGNPAGQLWTARPVTADRVRSRIELVLSWAAGRGHRGKDNPARWDDLKHILPKPTEVTRVTRHAAVPYAEVPALLAQLRQQEGVAVKALEFLILCSARVGEVIFATWSEMDLDAAAWTIPAERMKGKREHKVPLSPAAVDLLKSVYTEAGNDFVFIGVRGGSLSDSAMTATLRRLGRTETIHGFRSSFSDWAHEQTPFSNHAIELSLAHSIGNAVEKAYRRGDMFDKRRKLLEAWSKFCITPTVVSGDNVVTLGGVR